MVSFGKNKAKLKIKLSKINVRNQAFTLCKSNVKFNLNLNENKKFKC